MSKQTVIVTGASTGIGKSIARYFLDRDYNVVMNSATAANLEAAYAALGKPPNARLAAGDVSSSIVCEQLVTTALEAFGRVDILINNAGVFAPKPFLDVTASDIDHYYNINLKGTFFASQAAIRAMQKQGGGAIINIGTVLVDHAIAGFPASAPVVSKGGIHALTRQLAAEFGHQNITVNTIAPGIIRSPLQAKIGVDDADGLAGLHLLNRIGEPEEIAALVHAIATNRFITGAIINADGGHVAGHRFA
jgi:NAD(P)-dependent dehydrogenase (short-subunit alcohol dehydrogenase family)